MNVPKLSDSTHALCKRALGGEFGKAMSAHYCAIVDSENYDKLSPWQQYNACLEAIVEQAPIRLVDGELLAGSATFDKAREHQVPAALAGTDPKAQLFKSQSHLTPHYHKVIRRGLAGLKTEITASLENHKLHPEKVAYLQELSRTVKLMERWHRRYMDAIDQRIGTTEGAVRSRWQQVQKNLARVPMEPAGNFREAVQSLWFLFVFQRMSGNWAAVGRFDWMLGDFLEKDLEYGRITLEEAREYVAHFWIKGCEWVDTVTCIGHDDGGGDGQFYQNVVLSGRDETGRDETNTVTYLVLDVLEELRIADYPTSVRISKNSPEKLLRRCAEVIRLGGGLLAVYNDDTVIEALERFGYSPREACRYANDGCWEVQIPGKTNFKYWPWDVLAELQRGVLKLHDETASALEYESFDALFDAYIAHLSRRYRWWTQERVRNIFMPNLALSLFVEDCIGTAVDYGHQQQSGAVYQVCAPHAGGIVDAANALQAIKYVVYEEKLMSLNAFMDIIKQNWEGWESLRLRLRHLTYYGNGEPESDAMMKRLFNAYTQMVNSQKFYRGMLFPAGISTFGRQVTPEFLNHRTANPDGHKKGDFLSNNISPTPGDNLRGATAALRSYGSLDMKNLPGGTALELKLSFATVRGEDGLEGLIALLKAFCDLGCHFMQPDVVDAAALKKAQEDPERYGDLVVRVSGWSSRFRTLERQWQELVIQRTEMGY